MISKSILARLSIGLMVASMNVAAIPITVDDNISGNSYVSSSRSVNGQFDINSSLPSTGNYTAPFNITSATARFYFTDDYDPLRYQRSSATSYYYTNSVRNSNDTKYYYYRNRTNYYLNDPDDVRVSVAAQAATGGTSYYDPASYSTGITYDGYVEGGRYCDGARYLGYCPDWDYNYNFYYTREYTDISGWRGNLILDIVYDDASLMDLMEDGISSFNLTSVCRTCDILYLGGTLTLDIKETVVSSVPEPSVLLLMSMGMLGMGVVRRKVI